MNKWQKEHLETVPPMYQGTIAKAFTRQSSPRAAIKAFCLYCTGYQRVVVTECTSWACPLHPYRPFTGTKGAKKGKAMPETSGETITVQ